jgi:hypothetical protein
MKSGHRLTALIVIWIAFAVASSETFDNLSLNNSSGSAAAVAMTLIYVVGVIVASLVVMKFGGTDTDAAQRSSLSNQKPKRSDMGLAERLIDSMSDEELEALRQRLMGGSMTIGDDGELIPAERSSQRRR